MIYDILLITISANQVQQQNNQYKGRPSKMKKVYDWDVTLLIRVQNNNKTINMVCSVHTTVHQLKLEICKKLNLMIFDTEIDIYGGNGSGSRSWLPLKSTSSLLQNGIQNGTNHLKANIKRVKANPAIDVKVQQQESFKKRDNTKSKQQHDCGLTLLASCTNQSCINYQQDTTVHVGYGTFPFYSLVSELKCEVCPYRSQFLRPAMMCKAVRLNYCNYKLEGIKRDHQGIPTQMSTSYKLAKKDKDIMSTITSNDWDKSILLIVKHL